MIGNTLPAIGIETQRRAVRRDLCRIAVGNLYGISANCRCCISATSSGEKYHVEERPVVAPGVLMRSVAVLAANIVRQRPVRARPGVEQALFIVLAAGRIEVAGGKRMVVAR